MNQKKLIIVSFLVFLAIGGAAATQVVHFTKENAFCGSCHIMESYYLEYSTSSNPMPHVHNQAGVKCYDCHFESGILGRAEARKHEANMVLLYLFEEYRTPITCDMPPDRCLKCHPDYQQQTVDLLTPHTGVESCAPCHNPHSDTRLSNFYTYDCSSCHDTQPSGAHETVSCRGCHVRHGYAPECISCHKAHSPAQAATSYCISCHGNPHNVTKAAYISPDVSKKSCGVCHNAEFSTLARYNSAHNTFVGSHTDALRTYTYDFTKSCAGCHPAHAQAKSCTAPGCHFNHYHPMQDGCSWCHNEKYSRCTDCHIDAHNPRATK